MPRYSANRLEDTVESIFHSARFRTRKDQGIQHKRLTGHSRTSDLIVTFGNQKTLVECTTGGKPSISTEVNDLANRITKLGFTSGLYVASDAEVQNSHRKEALHSGIQIWDYLDLSYFTVLAKALGEFARFELRENLLHSTAENAKHLPLLATRQIVKHPRAEILSFSIAAKDLLSACCVYRKAARLKRGFQRLVKGKRLHEIARYFSGKSLLVNSVLAKLHDASEFVPLKGKEVERFTVAVANDSLQVGILTLKLFPSTLEIVDGQHRVYGFTHCSPAVRSKTVIPVIAVRGLHEDALRDLFVTVNDKAKRINANLICQLRYTPKESACKQDPIRMAIKIARLLGSDKGSPLHKHISVGEQGEGSIPEATLANHVILSMVRPKKILRKLVKPFSSKKAYNFISKYLAILRTSVGLPKWNDRQLYSFLSPKVIHAFFFLIQRIESKGAWDWGKVAKAANVLSKKFDFTRAHLKGQYGGAGGWRRLAEDLWGNIEPQF